MFPVSCGGSFDGGDDACQKKTRSSDLRPRTHDGGTCCVPALVNRTCLCPTSHEIDFHSQEGFRCVRIVRCRCTCRELRHTEVSGVRFLTLRPLSACKMIHHIRWHLSSSFSRVFAREDKVRHLFTKAAQGMEERINGPKSIALYTSYCERLFFFFARVCVCVLSTFHQHLMHDRTSQISL